MKKITSLVFLALTVMLIYFLNSAIPVGKSNLPPIGKFLSPQHGCWLNAVDKNTDYGKTIQLKDLNSSAEIYFDERLVPHVFAQNETDLYRIQGYLHARFRLWQMELQTHAAAGRAAEIVGKAALQHDREFRRLGMVYAAENTLKAIEADPLTKMACDAYTKGVNDYINELNERTVPLEYKMLDYMPEEWNNLKTALFMKYMAFDLSGHENDFELHNTRQFFSEENFNKLFPAIQDSLDPIIPKGTPFAEQTVFPEKPAEADSVYFKPKEFADISETKPDRENGSNNWAVSGKKTKSGSPILCSDPHLSLNLPSIWFEMQLNIPGMNIYGVSFPGAPGILIGFNDSCAVGFTNGGRDVRDYYDITFENNSRNRYLYNNEWHSTSWRVEKINVKGGRSFIDSVAYVALGDQRCPVMYDPEFDGDKASNKKNYAVLWSAHRPTNELKAILMLNRARNYADYTEAIVNLKNPGQNCAFAAKNGDIAIRTQGDWPAKWAGQGDFIMPGTSDKYLIQGYIPQSEVPFQYNPERGFVSSANQKPVDDQTYPYYLGRNYPLYRGIRINKNLNKMNGITVQDMMNLQNDNLNEFAVYAMPMVLKHLNPQKLSTEQKTYYELLKNWDLKNTPDSKGATIFELFWDELDGLIYNDEYKKAPGVHLKPYMSTLLEALLRDESYSFVDDIETPGVETLANRMNEAFKNISDKLFKLEKKGKLEWGRYRGTDIKHLSKLEPFSIVDLKTGGHSNCINATKYNHGPSWKMIVSLTEQTEAYGIFPGGQDGNPGSPYYSNYIEKWTKGEYYRLWVMDRTDTQNKAIVWSVKLNGDRQ